MDGEEIPDFFVNGDAAVELQNQGVEFVEFDFGFQTIEAMTSPHLEINSMWTGTIHLMRKPDRKMIQLLKVSKSGILRSEFPPYYHEEEDIIDWENDPCVKDYDSFWDGYLSVEHDSVSGISRPSPLPKVHDDGIALELDLEYGVTRGANKTVIRVT